MLIKTSRHTEKDLELWKDYEEFDSITEYSNNKVNKSISIIKLFLTLNEKSCIMTSWGKDSIVLLDLFCKTGIKKPVVYMRFKDRANPDCDYVRDYFLENNNIDYHEEVFNYSEVRKSGKHWIELFKKYGKRCTGIRNDESGVRALQWYINGYQSINSCRPLSLWSNQEVFAYIHKNKLPLSPVYGYLGGGRYKREKLRTHSLYGSSGDGIGRKEWEKEYYQDVLNRIEYNMTKDKEMNKIMEAV